MNNTDGYRKDDIDAMNTFIEKKLKILSIKLMQQKMKS